MMMGDMNTSVERTHSCLRALERKVSSVPTLKTGVPGVRIMRVVALMSGPEPVATASGIRVGSMTLYSSGDTSGDARRPRWQRAAALAIFASGCIALGSMPSSEPEYSHPAVETTKAPAVESLSRQDQLGPQASVEPVAPGVRLLGTVTKPIERRSGAITKAGDTLPLLPRDARQHREISHGTRGSSNNAAFKRKTNVPDDTDAGLSFHDDAIQLKRTDNQIALTGSSQSDWTRFLIHRRLTESVDDFIR